MATFALYNVSFFQADLPWFLTANHFRLTFDLSIWTAACHIVICLQNPGFSCKLHARE